MGFVSRISIPKLNGGIQERLYDRKCIDGGQFMIVSRELLFFSEDLSALIRTYEFRLKEEVEKWESNRILSTSEHDLVAYLVDKYTPDPPRLLRDQVYIDREGETKIDVSRRFEYNLVGGQGPLHIPGTYVTVGIPFEGDAKLFSFKASTRSLNPPYGRVSESSVLLTYQDVKLDGGQLRSEIDSATVNIEKHLEWIRNDCNQWNDRVPEIAKQCIRNRKQRLLEHSDMVSALGLPMKRRPDADTSLNFPLVRKKLSLPLPRTPIEPFKPEPTLSDSEYDDILDVIDRLALQIERSQSTFVNMKEENIRDIILVNLNGHYEGDATGETFNAEGKTDILVRAADRHAFVAECKFWKGEKALHAAIDQILGYLTWRNTKTSLVIFSENVDFTRVLSSIMKSVLQHPNYKGELKKVSETHVRYLFRQKHDRDRDLYLAVQVFNIPKVEQKAG